ncbi:MAG: alanine racemase [Dethiobacter sp.]|nr:alanine racemase [Dethiobacter sp.]
MSGYPLRPTWAEVDLTAIAHNVREFRRIIPDGTSIMAVVKADGYGHGAVQVARQAVAAGASFLGVALAEEGLELRKAGITAPILVLGFTPRASAPLLCTHDLIPTVFTLPEAEAFSAAAQQCGKKLPVHVKVDTGMSRIGYFPSEEADDFILRVASYPGLELAGLYTHFAAADRDDLTHTRWQLGRFLELDSRLAGRGLVIPVKHAANSAAAMYLPAAHLDMVRIGISLYGLHPAPGRASTVDLRPAMIFKSRIIYLKRVPAGTSVSYGCTFTTARDSLLASLPVGYADGYPRRLSNCGQVLVRGCLAPVAGRVCMDQTVIDVSDVPGVCLGDVVVLFGRQGDSVLAVDEVAEWLDTINYEVVTSVSYRVPRLYVPAGRISSQA